MPDDMAGSPDPSVSTFTVGGSVTGLTGTGLMLQLNGASDLPVSASGPFTFSGKIATGATYKVMVTTMPSGPAQTCTVSNGSGTVSSANVTQVAIVCATNAHRVGGNLSGLSGSVVLQNNGGDDLTLSNDGPFQFTTPVLVNGKYAVTVKTQPSAKICTVNSATGTVTTGSISSVIVSCAIPPTCKALKTANPAAIDGDYMIDPDGPGGVPALTAYCDMTTDGGGYTMYSVSTGISTNRFDQANSCDPLGLKLVIPRTKAHMAALIKKYTLSYFKTVPGVYGLAAGVFTGCVMNSTDATCGANWVAVDKGAWWARDSKFGEPNGNYGPGCWLSLTGQDANGDVVLDDANCTFFTGAMYVCSDNAKNGS